MAFCPNNDTREKGWCSWPIAIAFLLSLAVTIILIFALGPVESAVSSALSTYADFEPTDIGNDDGFSDWVPGRPSPTASPATPTTPKYKFMQCPENGDCCNGLESNCGLRLNETAFAMVHNAMSTKESGYDVGFNHISDLDGALEAGYRGLNLDVCKCSGKISFCHSLCGYGARDPAQVFLEIMSFLTKQTTETVVLVFQYSTGNATLAELFEVMATVDGFVDLMYTHNENEEWPLMRELLANKKRIVAFYHDAKDDCTLVTCPSELHNYFRFVADTPYAFKSTAEIQSWDSSCKVTRGRAGLKEFFNVNNFVTPPKQASSKVTNEQSFVTQRLGQCAAISGLVPNFITVDFWGEGAVPEVVQTLNTARAGSNVEL